jgi:translation initiation factor 2A
VPIASFVSKKASIWLPQWNKAESLCCLRGPNNEANFYANNDFSKVEGRLSIAKLESFSLSPGNPSATHIVCFIPGQKGGPSFGKLFAYPNFNPERDVIANKSFFQADNMTAEWSCDGKMVLLITQSEVDKTGGSYYGKQQLHFMSVSGDTAMVQLPKEGPIYSVTWSPTSPEFCVVYGFMPAKATLFNHKCDKIFDFGTGPRNMALFNPQGNLVMLGGFGNLRGNIEIWAVKDKKEVSKFEASDATDVRWSPCGQRILSSTCAPRLRMSNGLKIWHYTGSLLHEQPVRTASEELWEVTWRSEPLEKHPVFAISTKPVEGIKPQQPQASKQAYRPPNMRDKASTFKLHDEDEPAENQKENADGKGLSKAAAKNKRRRENAAKKKEEDAEDAGSVAPKESPVQAGTGFQSTGDAEKDKKLHKLDDKLQQIAKLKQQQKEGKQLELNQLDKLKKEAEIIAEMKQLRL